VIGVQWLVAGVGVVVTLALIAIVTLVPGYKRLRARDGIAHAAA
jgi:hypothetical protein